jgi:Ras-specific guanine nucleotide-releasing factor RalGPS
LTLIDLPLFKKIQPDELISCKWMSRDKNIRTPNIVLFTKRFNQTTFWAQKEILSCVKLETRAKMLTLFIKIAKRLQELQNFNSLMSIISALKSAPIHRLKKTWNLIARKDLNYFERICKIMLDTNDNKSKLREMHNNCKLPCIPFLGE